MSTSIVVVAYAMCAVVCIGYVDAGCCSAPLPSSCVEAGPICESGYFLVSSRGDGVTQSAYCSAEELCGSTGWTRVGIADFGNPQTPCPDGLIEYNEDGVRACKRESLSGPNSVTISTNGISYNQVCGTVQGYQFGSPDAFIHVWTGPKDIEEAYLDGVSVTHGPAGSRQHIFSLAAGVWEGNRRYSCVDGSTQLPPSFVGPDFYCESGNPAVRWRAILYKDDILWDGQQCGGAEGPSCDPPNLPYFYKDVGTTTTDDIELRILTNENISNNEDILLLSYEIYIK